MFSEDSNRFSHSLCSFCDLPVGTFLKNLHWLKAMRTESQTCSICNTHLLSSLYLSRYKQWFARQNFQCSNHFTYAKSWFWGWSEERNRFKNLIWNGKSSCNYIVIKSNDIFLLQSNKTNNTIVITRDGPDQILLSGRIRIVNFWYPAESGYPAAG